jgi:hypothetical protein
MYYYSYFDIYVEEIWLIVLHYIEKDDNYIWYRKTWYIDFLVPVFMDPEYSRF